MSNILTDSMTEHFLMVIDNDYFYHTNMLRFAKDDLSTAIDNSRDFFERRLASYTMKIDNPSLRQYEYQHNSKVHEDFNNLAMDMLQTYINHVNWLRIVEHYKQKIKEGA